MLLNDKEFCCSLIGLNGTLLVVPQSEFTSRESHGVYSGFQRCSKKVKISKISKISKSFTNLKVFIKFHNFNI